jgi:hypothetical protein
MSLFEQGFKVDRILRDEEEADGPARPLHPGSEVIRLTESDKAPLASSSLIRQEI